MNITLARIDDRLIHGQVTTVWSKVANAGALLSATTRSITMRYVGPYSARPRLRA